MESSVIDWQVALLQKKAKQKPDSVGHIARRNHVHTEDGFLNMEWLLVIPAVRSPGWRRATDNGDSISELVVAEEAYEHTIWLDLGKNPRASIAHVMTSPHFPLMLSLVWSLSV